MFGMRNSSQTQISFSFWFFNHVLKCFVFLWFTPIYCLIYTPLWALCVRIYITWFSHLGEEVALYCSKYLPDIIKEQKTYKDGKLQKVRSCRSHGMTRLEQVWQSRDDQRCAARLWQSYKLCGIRVSVLWECGLYFPLFHSTGTFEALSKQSLDLVIAPCGFTDAPFAYCFQALEDAFLAIDSRMTTEEVIKELVQIAGRPTEEPPTAKVAEEDDCEHTPNNKINVV